MGIEGSISLDLHWDGRTIRRAQVRSSRPLAASTLLQGKSWQEAESMVPLLFSICGRAQAVSAAGALEAARGVEPDAAVTLQRELLVAAECIQEYAWRVLLDLPALLGEAPQTERFVGLRRPMQAAFGRATADARWWHAPATAAVLEQWRDVSAHLSRLLAEDVLGMAGADWLALDYGADFDDWLEAEATLTAALLGRLWPSRLGRSSVPLLPRLTANELMTELGPGIVGRAGFAAAPTWRNAPAETGALARTAAHPLIAAALQDVGNTAAVRFLARLAELAMLDRRLAALARGEVAAAWSSCSRPAPATGFSATDTARGILLHLAQIDKDRVVSYRIVAPTEWNFHPQGAFVQGLAGFAADTVQAAEQAAKLMAHALDPCVAYQVTVTHA